MNGESRKFNPATFRQMNEQVKEIIETIPAEILQRVIGEFNRRIRNCVVARGRFFKKKIDTFDKSLKSQLLASSYSPWILKIVIAI